MVEMMVHSLKRAIESLDLEEPDRVPLFEQAFSKVMMEGILGRTPFASNRLLCLEMASKGKAEIVNEGIARDLIDATRKVGLDFIGAGGGYTKDVKPPLQVNDETWIIGDIKMRRSKPEGEGETFWDMDKFTVNWDTNRTFALIEELNAETEEINPVNVTGVLDMVVKEVGDHYFVYGGADGSWGPIVTNNPLLVKVLTWMYTEPKLVKDLIEAYTKRAIEVGKAQIDAGARGILMCVDYGYSGGPWMSPKQFRTFIQPALKAQCDTWHKRGAYALLHCDGNIDAILFDVVKGGIDAYQCIDVQAGMDIAKVKREVGQKICLIGNANLKILEKGTEREVAEDALRCVNAAAPGGGYVLSPSANVSLGTNLTNYFVMIKTARKYGRYS